MATKMAEYNSTISQLYHHCLEQGDPRLKGWPMMDTPVNTVVFTLLYLISLRFIRDYMAHRKPYELKHFLIAYNFLQVCASFYIFSEVLMVAYLSNYSLVCQPVDYSSNPLPLRMLSIIWYYYMSKLIDFIDTIVFALRKKQNQITVLHVFHHATMFPYGWIGLKYVGGGQTFFSVMLNSFVHTIMYGYYGLSAIGPSMQKYLWWKKYLTQLQLVQFFAMLIHGIVNMMSECSFPKGFVLSALSYQLLMVAFFLNFYFQSYKDRMNKKAIENKQKIDLPSSTKND